MSQHASESVDPAEVTTRAQLVDYLDQSLSGVAGQYIEVDDEGISQRASFVKSYLVEQHHGSDGLLNGAARRVFPRILPRDDSSFLLLYDRRGAPYFADLTDPRIAVIHTITPAAGSDRTIDLLFSGQLQGFDRAWIPTARLTHLYRGHLTGFKFGYSPRATGYSDPALDMERVLPVQTPSPPTFNMVVSNNSTAEEDFTQIMSSDLFRRRKALERLQFLVTDEETPADYVRNTIYASGKIVGSGTSVQSHLNTVAQVVEDYAELLREVESYRLGWETEQQGTSEYRGEPFIVSFPRDFRLSDVREFGDSIFRPVKPYRLMGIPHNSSPGRVDYEVIDLHTGDPFSVEITRSWMRVYLPDNTCGNVLLRLFFHLESTFVSGIVLATGSGEAVLS